MHEQMNMPAQVQMHVKYAKNVDPCSWNDDDESNNNPVANSPNA